MYMLIVLSALVALACSAAPTADPIQQTFNAVDSNKDNRIEVGEIMAFFDQVDTNNDGVLNFHEFSNNQPGAAADPQIRGRFDYYDKLGGAEDGQVQRSDVNIVYNRLDSNGDGQVTQHEFGENWPVIEQEIQAAIAGETAGVGK